LADKSEENPSCFPFAPDWWPQESGSPHPSESFGKIRRKPVPVLSTEFPGPWRLLATRPENEKWWSFLNKVRTHYQNQFE
jgi:hypothetical protein